MTTFETATYTLPSIFASALINGDYSGLSEYERAALQSFLADNDLGCCLSCGESEFFMRGHDMADLIPYACDCLEFTFPV